MNKFKSYQVVLHDFQKHAKTMKVRTCVSPSAACRVATYLDNMKGAPTRYVATSAYELDVNDLPIFKTY